MDEQEMREYLELGSTEVWKLVFCGSSGDKGYVPQPLYIKEVDWDNGVLKLSLGRDTEVVDISPFDEVFRTEEDALKFLNTYV